MGRVLSCPYLVTIMGIMDDKHLSIVMEYLQYGDLMNFNRKYMVGCDCWARKIKMIKDIALGMNFLHTQNPPVFHRDLKLENVFVGSGFAVKVCSRLWLVNHYFFFSPINIFKINIPLAR